MKSSLALFALAGALLVIPGCQTAQTPVLNPISHFTFYEPTLPSPPAAPDVQIRVLTKEQQLRGAYIGFSYDDWLKFAQWMKSYQSYNRDLKNIIDTYQQQTHQLEAVKTMTKDTTK